MEERFLTKEPKLCIIEKSLFFLPQLLKSSRGSVVRHRRHLDSTKPYIAAKLASLPTTFMLGDEKRYDEFFNKPLTSSQQYLCFVLAELQSEGTDSTAQYVSKTSSLDGVSCFFILLFSKELAFVF